VQYPLEVRYDYRALDVGLFAQPVAGGLDRWQPLLPPLLPGLSLGEGGTPLVRCPQLCAWAGLDNLMVKDESRNPTWSHKDRLNVCTVSAAVAAGALGVAISSSGNHGASAAAYASRAGLPTVVLCDEGTGLAAQQMMQAYGAAVVAMPREARWPLLEQLTSLPGWYLLGNTAATHTGHPFGPEGYKTIAYELFQQLGGRAPAAVAVPVSYAELLFGIWKGFEELRLLGAIEAVPMLVSAEPAACAPHAQAWEEGTPTASLPYGRTIARAIGSATSGYRGQHALRASGGIAWRVRDEDMLAAQEAMSADGLWAEVSSCASLAVLRDMGRSGFAFHGPVVAISTSSGLKDIDAGKPAVPRIHSRDWSEFATVLRERYELPVHS
jgi:threonine synthase